jgi:hypothetical protein
MFFQISESPIFLTKEKLVNYYIANATLLFSIEVETRMLKKQKQNGD